MQQMENVTLQGELPQPSKPRKKFWNKFWHIFWLLLFTIVIALSSQVIYDYTRYVSFYVNGDSMYPTLNADAVRIKDGVSEGSSTHKGDWRNYDEDKNYSYLVDYGLMDSKPGFIDSLKRFDIVVCYFDKDYLDGSSVKTDEEVNQEADLKIKRLIGLPGESLYFSLSGSLFIKEAGQSAYQEVAQPQSIIDDGNLAKTADAISNSTYGTAMNHVTLQANEYFVVGDNRRYGASQDSRDASCGPLGSSYATTNKSGQDLIKGKAVAITGMANLSFNSDGSVSHSISWSHFRMPWSITNL